MKLAVQSVASECCIAIVIRNCRMVSIKPGVFNKFQIDMIGSLTNAQRMMISQENALAAEYPLELCNFQIDRKMEAPLHLLPFRYHRVMQSQHEK